MKIVKLESGSYPLLRPLRGGYNNRFNRVVKLLKDFDHLTLKFDRMIARGKGVTDTARLALACKMLMYTGIRAGNESSAEGYITTPHPNSKEKPRFVKTYGLTTLLPEHVITTPYRARFNFIGKRQVDNSFVVTGDLAKQVRQLYKYSDVTLFDITAYDLKKFIKVYVGEQFTPKDFRTLRANMVALDTVKEIDFRKRPTTKRELNAEIKEVAVKVSQALNNTPGVCKASYIDPLIWDYFTEIRTEQDEEWIKRRIL